MDSLFMNDTQYMIQRQAALNRHLNRVFDHSSDRLCSLLCILVLVCVVYSGLTPQSHISILHTLYTHWILFTD